MNFILFLLHVVIPLNRDGNCCKILLITDFSPARRSHTVGTLHSYDRHTPGTIVEKHFKTEKEIKI